jgi:hypothetical protein
VKIRALWLLAGATIVFGCTPPASTGEASKTASKTEAPSVPAEPARPGEASAKIEEVPAELRHDGFEYYGLGNANPIDYEITTSANSGIITGSQFTRVLSTGDGKALFSIERTGQLGDLLGTSEVELTKDGVYVLKSTIAEIESPELELPARLTPGATWKSRTKVEQDGRAMDVTNEFRVVGTESVTTAAGTFPALLISSTGTGTLQGSKVRMDTKSWHVKGRGAVKQIVTSTPEKGPPQKVTLVETKRG